MIAMLAACLTTAGCSETEEEPTALSSAAGGPQPLELPVPDEEPAGDGADTDSEDTADETSGDGETAEEPEDTAADGTEDEGEVITTDTGLQYIILEEGEGEVAEPGDTVAVHYTGTLKSTGAKFDSSLDRGEPIVFPLGAGAVIAGWDEGIAGMKAGEKRKLIIPSDLAYGSMGSPPVIPPNADLVFETELVEVR
ncbi:MAG: FKBP-type peptidyl-prolyl cis-trans isomerase [Armatimonadia bacterium]|nr:FKBP-type peptidyl-prolyl cis-trans isomerase [Armatimonadia bacterium]